MRFPACCRCRFWRGWRRRRCRCRCRGSRCGWFRHLLLHTNKALIPPRPMRLEEPGTQKNTFDSTNSSKRAVDAVEDWPPHSDADLLLPSMEDEGWNIQKCNLYHRVEPAAAWTWTKTFTCSQNLTDSPATLGRLEKCTLACSSPLPGNQFGWPRETWHKRETKGKVRSPTPFTCEFPCGASTPPQKTKYSTVHVPYSVLVLLVPILALPLNTTSYTLIYIK